MSDLRVVATGLCFPEGPVAMPDGSIVLGEIERQTLSRILPDGTVQVIAHTGGAWRLEENLFRPVMASSDYVNGSIQRVDPVTGAVSVLYDKCGANKLNGPNDIVFDANGGFYFTDLGKTRASDRDNGLVYYALANGSKIVEVASPMLTPNGISLSPDGAVLYVAETEPARLWAFDITEPGAVKKQGWPSPHGGRLVIGLPGLQRFDSLAVDAAGNICVATLLTGAISVIAPDGCLVRQVPMGDPVTTNICFSGADLRTAYITLSGTGQLVAMDWPEPGLRLNHQ